jgi:KDO2-lipid IV(A) lauroyltransferase
MYHVVGYRKEITMANLLQAFPEKIEADRIQIAKNYYKNLCDNILETIKLLSISKSELNKRFTSNWDTLNTAFNNNKAVVGYLSHQFNWEWGSVVANWNMPYTFVGTYLPLTNLAFDKLILKIRSRSGSLLVSVPDMQSQMTEMQNKNKIVWGFIADQNPSDIKRVLWFDFLNKKTAFAKGAEFVARRYNNMVYFGTTEKIKRGYYHLHLTLMFDNPKSTSEGEITSAYVKFLEKTIKHQPENWVWSHRRWKHEYKNI